MFSQQIKEELIEESIDILENEIREKYPKVFEMLLFDHTTQKNILWATNNYKSLGVNYQASAEIVPDLITGDKGNIIMPRVRKNDELKELRVRDMAEVFTPSWICNAQNNLIDNAWFERENVFNFEITEDGGRKTWTVNDKIIEFPKDKTWMDYVRDIRLEITCGEAPYLASRYDTTTGEFIPLQKRIGLLDRKLRVINENVSESGPWLKVVQTAYRSIYGYEWQGDSLLLAREALLFTFIENYRLKFGKEPQRKSIQFIAYIISWNIWQMDGLKGVVPNSCGPTYKKETNLFEERIIESSFCEGCLNNDISKHTGIYCLIKDWTQKDPKTNRSGKKIKFIDVLGKGSKNNRAHKYTRR